MSDFENEYDFFEEMLNKSADIFTATKDDGVSTSGDDTGEGDDELR